jgi:CubicO group peptidase (beta-lactamase class C family)
MTCRSSFSFYLLSALLVSGSARVAKSAQPTPALRRAAERIEAEIHNTMRENHVPGMAFALTSREGLLYSGSYGFANKDSQAAVKSKTLFGIGSIGKSFTAVAALQLRDRGLLDPHAPLSKYLTWFKPDSTEPITMHHLLTHTAGFPGMRMELMSSLIASYHLYI